jgi:hypothetical protein
VKFYLLDNSSKTLLVDDTTTFREITETMLIKMHVQDTDKADYFGIYTSEDGNSISHVNNKDDYVFDTVEGLGHEARLVFMIRLFMPSIRGIQTKERMAQNMEKDMSLVPDKYYFESSPTTDENLLVLQYIQAVYYIITGVYPTDYDTALTLGSLYFLEKFGRVDRSSLKAGLIGNNIVEYIPLKHMKGKDPADVELALLGRIEDYLGIELGDNAVVREYMTIIWQMSNFSEFTFFRGMIRNESLPDKAIMGISHRSIIILNKNRELAASYTLEFILRWGYHPGRSFFFDANGADDAQEPIHIQLDIKNGQDIADLLADYALSFMKEAERTTVPADHESDDGEMEQGRDDSRISKSSKSAFGSLFNNAVVEEDAGSPIPDVAGLEEPEDGATVFHFSEEHDAAALKLQSLHRGNKARAEVAVKVQAMVESGQIDMSALTEGVEQVSVQKDEDDEEDLT